MAKNTRNKCAKCRRFVPDDTWKRLEHLFRYHRPHAVARLAIALLDPRLDATTKLRLGAYGMGLYV